jgi:hypothetical protein
LEKELKIKELVNEIVHLPAAEELGAWDIRKFTIRGCQSAAETMRTESGRDKEWDSHGRVTN